MAVTLDCLEPPSSTELSWRRFGGRFRLTASLAFTFICLDNALLHVMNVATPPSSVAHWINVSLFTIGGILAVASAYYSNQVHNLRFVPFSTDEQLSILNQSDEARNYVSQVYAMNRDLTRGELIMLASEFPTKTVATETVFSPAHVPGNRVGAAL